MSRDAEFIRKLEDRGEVAIREENEKGKVAEHLRPAVKQWLDHKDRAREEARRDKSVDTDTRANEIAEDANALAGQANRIAIGAIVFAGIAIVISVIALIKA